MPTNGFKTVIFGLLIAGISILSNAEMQAFISANLPWVGSGVATAIVILRALTSSAIFNIKKKE